MLFLIRTAFWLMIIVLLLPTDAQQRSEVYGTAQAAVNDVATFCDRNPETCARGKDAFGVFVQKAQFGARMLMDLINGRTESGEEEAPSSEGRSLFEPASFDVSASQASQDTLNPEDREEAWSGPAPAGIDIPGVFRETPGGVAPEKMMSVGIVVAFSWPLPVRHSPKAIVLLVPSVIWPSSMHRPLGPTNWKTPLGSPPVSEPWWLIDEPTQAK